MQNKILIGLALTLAVLVFIPLYWATESGRQAEAREQMKAEAFKRGGALYASQCASCHGPGGGGGVGPALKSTRLDEPTLHKIIARGVAGKAMPAFGEEDSGPLNTHQVNDLVVFIKDWESLPLTAIGAEGATPAHVSPAPTSAPAASADRGKAIFEGKCGGCHTIDGLTAGTVGPNLTQIGTVAETRVPGTSAEDYIHQSIVDPSAHLVEGFPDNVMPKNFNTLLSEEQLSDLIAFLLSLK